MNKIETVGVIGAGIMGAGIANSIFRQNKHNVKIFDKNAPYIKTRNSGQTVDI